MTNGKHDRVRGGQWNIGIDCDTHEADRSLSRSTGRLIESMVVFVTRISLACIQAAHNVHSSRNLGNTPKKKYNVHMYNIFAPTIVACCFLRIVTSTEVIDTDFLQEQLAM